MDAITKKRSPFSTEPRIDEDGVIYDPVIGDYDDRLFELMGRFEYLTIPYIAGLSGRGTVAIRNVLPTSSWNPDVG
jgi:hypothetical protein